MSAWVEGICTRTRAFVQSIRATPRQATKYPRKFKIFLDTKADRNVIGVGAAMFAKVLSGVVRVWGFNGAMSSHANGELKLLCQGKTITLRGIINKAPGSECLYNPEYLNDETKEVLVDGSIINFEKVKNEQGGWDRFFWAEVADKHPRASPRMQLERLATAYNRPVPLNDREVMD